jgi:predicted  nucleic acid-binding Zn-ribbon protein
MIFATFSIAVSAQKPIRVSEDSVPYGTSRYPGIVISIPEVSYDRTQKNWVKELQSGTKSNVVTEAGDMSIFGAIVKDISPTPLNIYSKLSDQDSMLVLMACFEMKKDQFIEKSTGDAQLLAAKEYLKEFAKNQYLDFIKDEVQAEDKKLKDLNNELSSLQNQKTRMQKSIQSNRTAITEAKDNILLLNNELTKLSTEIISQNNQLTSMDEGAAKEEKASYIKDLEKRKKKILNDIESAENRITRANNDINEADRDIPRNESDQETLRGKVAQQEQVVQQFTEKLNTVKAY